MAKKIETVVASTAPETVVELPKYPASQFHSMRQGALMINYNFTVDQLPVEYTEKVVMKEVKARNPLLAWHDAGRKGDLPSGVTCELVVLHPDSDAWDESEEAEMTVFVMSAKAFEDKPDEKFIAWKQALIAKMPAMKALSDQDLLVVYRTR